MLTLIQILSHPQFEISTEMDTEMSFNKSIPQRGNDPDANPRRTRMRPKPSLGSKLMFAKMDEEFGEGSGMKSPFLVDLLNERLSAI